MTIGEAIEILDCYDMDYVYSKEYSHKFNEARNMVIKALEQEPMREFTEEEAKAYSKALDKMYKPTGMNVEDLLSKQEPSEDMTIAYLMGYYADKEPNEDAVSRQIISDYVGNHIQEINTGYGDLNEHTNRILRMIVDYIDGMPSVTPKPIECEDTVSRQAVSEWYCNMTCDKDYCTEPCLEHKQIMMLPSVQPKAKTGRWINQDEGAHYPVECCSCHKEPLLDQYGDYVLSDFCPNCGTDMRGDTDANCD